MLDCLCINRKKPRQIAPDNNTKNNNSNMVLKEPSSRDDALPSNLRVKLCLGLAEKPVEFMNKYPGCPLRCISHMMTFVYAELQLTANEDNSYYIANNNVQIKPENYDINNSYTDMQILDIDIPASQNKDFMKQLLSKKGNNVVIDVEKNNIQNRLYLSMRDGGSTACGEMICNDLKN